jgi:hypothetical protein
LLIVTGNSTVFPAAAELTVICEVGYVNPLTAAGVAVGAGGGAASAAGGVAAAAESGVMGTWKV